MNSPVSQYLKVCPLISFTFLPPRSDGSHDGGSGGDAAADGEVYNVGIVQLVQHDALDKATKGFQDALVKELGALLQRRGAFEAYEERFFALVRR